MLLGYPGDSVVKNLPAHAGDTSSILRSGRSTGEGNGNPLQYSCLDQGAWQATVHGVPKSQTWLSDWTATKAGESMPSQQLWSQSSWTQGPSEVQRQGWQVHKGLNSTRGGFARRKGRPGDLSQPRILSPCRLNVALPPHRWERGNSSDPGKTFKHDPCFWVPWFSSSQQQSNKC